MSHPVTAVYVDGTPVAKGDVRAYEVARGALVLLSSGEIQTLNMGSATHCAVGGFLYRFDAADVTSAHDGVVVLVDIAGRRFKRIKAIADLSSAEIVALIANGTLPLAKLAPGAADTLLMSDGAAIVNKTMAELVAKIDTALGSSDWRQPFPVLASRVSLLADNNTRMTGGNIRAAVFADGVLRVAGRGYSNAANGDSTGSNRGDFRRIAFASTPPVITKLYLGSHAGYILDASGFAWSWGRNNTGALGHGDTNDRALVTRIDYFVSNAIPLSAIIPIWPGNSADPFGVYFLGQNGKVYYAGSRANGAAGDGGAASGNQTSPVECGSGSLTSVAEVFVGATAAVYVRRTDNSWRVWGLNANGQLGLGNTTSPQLSPQAVAGMQDFTKVVCSGDAALALKSDGTIHSVGRNDHGQLGQGDTTQRTSWTQIASFGTAGLDIATGDNSPSCAAIISIGGVGRHLRTWGRNDLGSLGLGNTTTPQTSPQIPAGSWQGTVDEVRVLGGDWGATNGQALVIRSSNELWGSGFHRFSYGLGSNVSSFTQVVGHKGTILGWVPCGHSNECGLMVLTDLGCYGGGANSNLDTGTAEGATNDVRVLQEISVNVTIAPRGVNFRGAYAGGTQYAPDDWVQYQGSSWRAKLTTTGNAPPTLPTESNTWWELAAKKGDAGALSAASSVDFTRIADPAAPGAGIDRMYSGLDGRMRVEEPGGTIALLDRTEQLYHALYGGL